MKFVFLMLADRTVIKTFRPQAGLESARIIPQNRFSAVS
jgi:hypothetical protein